jgi:O-antigen/teichoic acid export membrane protein
MELAGMVTILSIGGGLRSLGTVVLLVALLAGLWRMSSVPTLCPELHVSLSLFRWSTAKEMLRFGLKTLAIRSPLLILVQTTNLLIASHLGPASLAVFSRSLALVRHTEGFMSKFAFILAPTAGSLQGQGKEGEMRRFFLDTTRYGVAFASPMLFFLTIDGDLILRLWMGERYVHGPVLAILAIGYFLPISQNSVREILKGMNAHGKIGLFCFGLTGACFLSGYLIFRQTAWTLDSAAILLAISLGVGLGLPPPVYACIKLKTSVTHYLRHSLLPPLICNSVFIASLLAGRHLFPTSALIAIGTGGAVGVLLLTPLYLRFVFPLQGVKIWLKFKEKLNWK